MMAGAVAVAGVSVAAVAVLAVAVTLPRCCCFLHFLSVKLNHTIISIVCFCKKNL